MGKDHIGSGKKMVIISGYFSGESYGLLGPQMAATVITENTDYHCIVVAVTKEDNKDKLKSALKAYFGTEKHIYGFSTLAGREDLFLLSKDLKDSGAFTILAGPQADVDFLGEKGWEANPHYFKGLSGHFSVALHGPVEQIIEFLNNPDITYKDIPGLLYKDEEKQTIQNLKSDWNNKYLDRVSWGNIYRLHNEKIKPFKITSGQILQNIGCPHAAKEKIIEIDPPVLEPDSITGPETGISAGRISIPVKGCSFCDVAVDKGFSRSLDISSVIRQIGCLPETSDNRNVPFELINENPLPGLVTLVNEIIKNKLLISQINLTIRADYFTAGEKHLVKVLEIAEETGFSILVSSIGFESFDDTILKNLNKGADVKTNLEAVRTMRKLKNEFPMQFKYLREEGAIHGHIHPTPWDNQVTTANINRRITMSNLPSDILPDHSIPLIIHHASGLGSWIRELEMRYDVRFPRLNSIICWWEMEKTLVNTC